MNLYCKGSSIGGRPRGWGVNPLPRPIFHGTHPPLKTKVYVCRLYGICHPRYEKNVSTQSLCHLAKEKYLFSSRFRPFLLSRRRGLLLFHPAALLRRSAGVLRAPGLSGAPRRRRRAQGGAPGAPAGGERERERQAGADERPAQGRDQVGDLVQLSSV